MTIEQKVEALRREFDGRFSLPHAMVQEAAEDYLAIRIAGDAYLLRLQDLAAVAANRTIVPLPSRRPECLGLIGHQGSPIALFSLRGLLGYGASSTPPRWTAVLRDSAASALGFDEYDGLARIAVSELTPLGAAAPRRFVTGGARWAGQARLIVDLPAIVKSLAEPQR
jgi:chemotaxis signal transduction protein